MEQGNRKRVRQALMGGGRRVWAFLGALWLVTACLAGCVPPASGGTGTVQQTEQQAAQERQPSEVQKSHIPVQSGEGQESVPREQEGTVPESDAPVRQPEAERTTEEALEPAVEESGVYTSKEEVALYIHLYGHLPDNYITKREAEDLGWDSRAGNLWEVAPGMSIGGSRFGNYEGALPDKEGRKYYECDIDYEGGYRGAKRIIYSDDGLIFYTEDHYKTFEELYGQ